MYFVDRKQIEETLTYMEKSLTLLEQQKSWDSEMEKLGLERIVHTLIEAVIDVGNHMIDGFIMRDPGSYEDIVDILEDEKVVTKETSALLKEIVRYRKVIIQSYRAINHEELLQIITKNINGLKTFPADVRRYLEKELGPVSAFLPNK